MKCNARHDSYCTTKPHIPQWLLVKRPRCRLVSLSPCLSVHQFAPPRAVFLYTSRQTLISLLRGLLARSLFSRWVGPLSASQRDGGPFPTRVLDVHGLNRFEKDPGTFVQSPIRLAVRRRNSLCAQRLGVPDRAVREDALLSASAGWNGELWRQSSTLQML